MLVKMRDPTLNNPFSLSDLEYEADIFIERRFVFEWLSSHLENSAETVPLIIEGSPGSGRTTVLNQIVGGRLGEEIIPVYLDLSAMQKLNLTEFLWAIAKATMTTLEIRGIQDPAIEKRLLILRPWQAFIQHFWVHIRQIAESQLLLYCFDNFNALLDDGHDYDQKADLRQRLSSLFDSSVGLRILLTLTGRFEAFDPISLAPFQNALNLRIPVFRLEETVELLGKAGSFPVFVDIAEYLHLLTGGHPGDIQRLGYALHQHGREKRLRQITIADIVFLLENQFQPKDFYSAIYRQKSLNLVDIS